VEKTDLTPAPVLFGTDGIRGIAGAYPLDPQTVRRVGAALVRALPARSEPYRVLIGRDTRESGVWMEEELAIGASSQGARVSNVGIVPTPAVAYLTRAERFDAGIVISASHNPFEDNGIKVFSGSGEKFSEAIERRVEQIIADRSWTTPATGAGETTGLSFVDDYLDHLRSVLERPAPGQAADPVSLKAALSRMTIAVDCANGATTTVAPRLFDRLGMRTVWIGNQPDGRNINLDTGSTHPEPLAALVRSSGAALGVAFDGDGDRAIFVDHHGRIVDGDAVLFLCARQLQAEGRLRGDAIVATVMSNIGLEIALKQQGIGMIRCAVGDKYVMEEMAARGLSLGGEQSGHIIFSDYLFTGDGLCTALNVLRTILVTGRTLAELAADLKTYPQVLLNLRVREKAELRSIPAVAGVIDRVEQRLAGNGRLLVRYSGTEPLLRVMIEGQDQDQIRGWAEEIIEAAREAIG
jgi:phosphoglucosamine mutase